MATALESDLCAFASFAFHGLGFQFRLVCFPRIEDGKDLIAGDGLLGINFQVMGRAFFGVVAFEIEGLDVEAIPDSVPQVFAVTELNIHGRVSNLAASAAVWLIKTDGFG